MKKILLIDGNSIVFKAFYASFYKRALTTKSGLNVNALLGFSKMILKLLEKETFTHFLVLFDTGKKTFRNDILKSYKENRKPAPPELVEQFPYIREFLDYINVKYDQKDGYEADDLIGSYSKYFSNLGYEVEIFSGDLDLCQLIKDNVSLKILKTGVSDIVKYTPEKLYEETSLRPNQYAEYLSLVGDPSDNIKGVPGVGDKTGISLLNTYGSIENIYKNLENISQNKIRESLIENKNNLEIDKMLASINCDVNLKFSEEDLLLDKLDKNRLLEFLRKYELFSLAQSISKTNFKSLEVTCENNKLDYKIISSDDLFKNLDLRQSYIYLEVDNYNYHMASLIGASIIDYKNNLYFLEPEYFLNSLKVKEYLEDSNLKKIVFDLKKNIVFLSKYNIKILGVIDDILLSAYLFDVELGGLEVSKIASYFKNNTISLDAEIYKKNNKESLFENNIYKDHIVKKILGVKFLYPILKEKIILNNQEKLLYEIEMPLSYTLSKLEIEGIYVDLDLLNEFYKKYSKKINDLEEKILSYSNKKINLQSPKQVQDFLYNYLNISRPRKNKSATTFSTSSDILEEKLEEHPVISYILEYRKYTKILSSYIIGIKDLILKDGKVHTIYTQTITRTGRLSSIYPNLQNIPIRDFGKEIRKVFSTNSKNLSYVSFDYSQIELRILAHLSNNKELIDEFKMGRDIHLETAKKIFKKNNITDMERHIAKSVNFGIIYGISDFGLASDLKITRNEAKKYLEEHKKNYPNLYIYLNNLVENAKNLGYTKTIFNRMRNLKNISSNNLNEFEEAKRLALNTPVQGSAADIIKVAMIKIDEYLEKNNLKTKMVMQIHDELTFLTPDDELSKIKEDIPKIMSNFPFLNVKLDVKMESGKDLLYNA